MKANLGCGDDYREGWLNVDHRRAGPGNNGDEIEVDLQSDLNELPWPFQTNSFEYIVMDNVLEHLNSHLEILREVHRVLEPDGTLELAGPHWNSVAAWRDPTHVKPFDWRMFDHHLLDHRWEVQDIELWKIGKANYLPDRLAIWLADHIGHVVGGFKLIVSPKPGRPE